MLLLAPPAIAMVFFVAAHWPAKNDSPGESFPAVPGGGFSAGPDVSATADGTNDGSTEIPTEVASPDDVSASGGADQAMAVDALLGQAANDRQQVQNAVADLQVCGSNQGISASVDALNQAADNRSALADQVNAANVDQISRGDEAAGLLVSALRASADADRSFAAWGGDLKRHCSLGSTTNYTSYKRGLSVSEQATAYKQQFVSLWNTIADAYGLGRRTETDI